MNFISHFYLERIDNDHYYNAGLTIPDLLGFMRQRVRLTEKKLQELAASVANRQALSLFAGMLRHLMLDTWFHSSAFFKYKSMEFQEYYKQQTEIDLPHFMVHIIIEMLIDKLILTENLGIQHDFYAAYLSINLREVVNWLAPLDKMDQSDFYSVLQRFAHSTYVGEYSNVATIAAIANRVSERHQLKHIISQAAEISAIEEFYNSNTAEIATFLRSHQFVSREQTLVSLLSEQ